MANEAKPQSYDPMKNLPNRKDPETRRLLEHYAHEFVVEGESKEPRKKFELCPVPGCGYAMAYRGEGPARRLVCAWEPLHTPPPKE